MSISGLAPHEVKTLATAKDIDELGHVSNLVYLRWVQDAAASHRRVLAREEELAAIAWVVRRHEIDYLAAAKLGDHITLRTWVGRAKGATFERYTEILREGDQKLLARAFTLWCPTDRLTGRLARLAADLRERVSAEPRSEGPTEAMMRPRAPMEPDPAQGLAAERGEPFTKSGEAQSAADVRIQEMTEGDWAEVRAIYEEGILGGLATFETRAPSWEEWDASRLPHSRLVARDKAVLGWAALSPVSPRPCYGGVAEVAVYVTAAKRRQGIGQALVRAAEAHGIWTLQGATLAENEESLALQVRCGFRVVGRRERIARLGGVWRDTVLTERRSRSIGL